MERLDKALDELIEVGIGTHHTLHLADRVDDGGVVFSAKALADIGKARCGELLGHIHGDLAGQGDRRGVVASLEIRDFEALAICHELLDHVHIDDAIFVR